MIDDDALLIYTDGSMFGKPRRGGFAFRFVYNDDSGNEVVEDFCPQGHSGATSIQMELKACVEALKAVSSHPRLYAFSKITVSTDSQYVRDNVPNAIFNWPKTRWQRQGGAPVLNVDLWKGLVREIKALAPLHVDFKWVRGHSGDIHNSAVDKLARKSAKGVLREPLSIVNVGKKTTTKQVQIGCVEMCGQRMVIQIINSQFLRTQKVYRYKYQVVSKGSKYFDMVDQIYSLPKPPIALSRWHKYRVSVNKDTRNPTIMKVLEELGT